MHQDPLLVSCIDVNFWWQQKIGPIFTVSFIEWMLTFHIRELVFISPPAYEMYHLNPSSYSPRRLHPGSSSPSEIVFQLQMLWNFQYISHISLCGIHFKFDMHICIGAVKPHDKFKLIKWVFFYDIFYNMLGFGFVLLFSWENISLCYLCGPICQNNAQGTQRDQKHGIGKMNGEDRMSWKHDDVEML